MPRKVRLCSCPRRALKLHLAALAKTVGLVPKCMAALAPLALVTTARLAIAPFRLKCRRRARFLWEILILS